MAADSSEPLRRTLRYADQGTPPAATRPGHQCPERSGELTFLLLNTRASAVDRLVGPDGGKTAHYMLRWLSTRGEGAVDPDGHRDNWRLAESGP